MNTNHAQQQLNHLFHALGDPTRREMVARLAAGPMVVSELGAGFPITAPAISKHLRILQRAGLLNQRKHGRKRVCSLDPTALDTAEQWIAFHRAFWTRRLDTLQELLEPPAE